MKLKKPRRRDLIFFAIIALLIIPQTRQPIQVLLHKGLAMIGPSIEKETDRRGITFEEWKLQDLDGNILNFKDLEDKVVFLNFWATCARHVLQNCRVFRIYMMIIKIRLLLF